MSHKPGLCRVRLGRRGGCDLSGDSQIQAPPIPTRALDDLAEKANYHHAEAEKHLWNAVTHAIHAGRYLIDAKAQMKRGEWPPWVKLNLDFSERTAQVYKQLGVNSSTGP